jgi:hypothetical protein
MILIDILALVGVGFVLLLFAAAASSLESLLWWAGWDKTAAAYPSPALPESQASEAVEGALPAESDSYVVYLSGAGTMDPARMDEKELRFLAQLYTGLAGSTFVTDVFPYSPTNRPLTDERWLRRQWNYVLRARRVDRRQRSTLQRLGIHAAQFRNVLQVAVSADRRYGPVYNYGVARAIAASLLRHGYRIGSSKPVILMVLSGAGQISVGCTPLLRRMLGRPIWIISIGSILADDPGILEVEHLYHLSGSLDRTQHIGKLFYPGLWSIFPRSAPNMARKMGKISVIAMGPMKHMGIGDYMSRSALLPDGSRHVDRTVGVLVGLVREIEGKVHAGTEPPATETQRSQSKPVGRHRHGTAPPVIGGEPAK